ncbi:pentatricopeptide repeat-containing protein At1g71060, mitochondrial-like [Abrus precatorius]|uniref:Pentatricopeptide repeat-containing protein At1g71060, mitochondrial-like n=1 Tax=Abrus precatorius TaxID=3816 RepID=A0A8B8M9W9_ABRPR|nr:pentatricopeptide repeat-containing protein At1g71060, mitochondrial-like [Abrus precatorius]
MALLRSYKKLTNPNLVPLSKSLSPSSSSNLEHHHSIPTFQLTQIPYGFPKIHTSASHTDAETICKVLSNTRDSTVDASLRNVPVTASPELVVEVLNRLSNAGVLALSFFRWAEKQEGFKHTTESFHALIEALGKIRQFKMIWSLVDDMNRRKLLTGNTFSFVARRYTRAKKVDEAVETFEKMEKYGLKPQVLDFNRLIDVLCKSKFVEKAQEVFDKMRQLGLTPDIKSYTILLEGWSQQQNLLRVDEVCREMKDEGFELDVVAYCIIINAYCKAKKYDEAIGFYHEMQAKGTRPSPHIYSTLISGLGSDKRLHEALEFFEKSKASGFAPDAPTYNAVVGAYCHSMQIDDAYRMVDEMKKHGIGPNSRTCDIILHHLIKARRIEQACLVFERMSDEWGCEPTLSTYEIMVRMFCNEERLDAAMAVWDQMKAKGLLPGINMFSMLIIALCHENKLDEASKYFQQMLDAGIRPPSKMFSTFKYALINSGMENTALYFALKIDKLRKSPLVAWHK